jgi:hypothetical protein
VRRTAALVTALALALALVGLQIPTAPTAAAHHRPWHNRHNTTTTTTTRPPTTTTTTRPTTTTTRPATTTTTTAPPSPTGCDLTADGAPQGSPTRGPSTFTTSQTVSNVIFDGAHSDDLVRVYGVGTKVVFDHVTFRGTGTGSTGHSVEVKRGGAVEIRNSLWNGRPSEDSIQFGGPNGDQHSGHSIVRCSTIASNPGEDHADFKQSQTGAVVDFIDNLFATPTPGGRTVQNDGSVGRQNFIRNTGLANVLLENTANGSLVGNPNIGQLYVYNSRDWLIQANIIARLQNGVGDGRNPSGIYYLANTIGQFVYYGGSCWATGNSLNLPQCTVGAPPWYPR